MKTSSGSEDQATLQVSIVEATDKELVLRYSVHNGSSTEIGLFNRLARSAASPPKPDPSLFYSYLEGDQLILARWVAEPPKGVNVSLPVVPYIMRVAPGGTLEETVHVPLPIPIWDAYQHARNNLKYDFKELKKVGQEAQRLSVAIGFFPVERPGALYSIEPDVFSTTAPGIAVAQQRIVRTAPLRQAVPVTVDQP